MIKSGQIGNISDLAIGQRGRVIEVRAANRESKRHLLDMGVIKGTVISVKKISPLGDPIDIALRGYELCMSKAEARQIRIEVIE